MGRRAGRPIGAPPCLWPRWSPAAKADLWPNPVKFDGTCYRSTDLTYCGEAGSWGVSVRGVGGIYRISVCGGGLGEGQSKREGLLWMNAAGNRGTGGSTEYSDVY